MMKKSVYKIKIALKQSEKNVIVNKKYFNIIQKVLKATSKENQ